MTIRLIRVLNATKSVLFGEWNGLQVFLVPSTVFFLIDDASLRLWFIDLFTRQMFYIPMVLFVLLLLFLLVMVIKYSVSMESLPLVRDQRKDMLFDYVLGIHELLLVVIFSFMVIYVLTAFLRYFYSIHFPLRYIYLKIFQFMAIGMILYAHLRSTLLKVTFRPHHSPKRNTATLLLYIRRNQRLFLWRSLISLALILISVHVFKWTVYFFWEPLIALADRWTGTSLRFSLVKVSSTPDLFYNLYILFSTYMLSNALFSPIVKLFDHLAQHIALKEYKVVP